MTMMDISGFLPSRLAFEQSRPVTVTHEFSRAIASARPPPSAIGQRPRGLARSTVSVLVESHEREQPHQVVATRLFSQGSATMTAAQRGVMRQANAERILRDRAENLVVPIAKSDLPSKASAAPHGASGVDYDQQPTTAQATGLFRMPVKNQQVMARVQVMHHAVPIVGREKSGDCPTSPQENRVLGRLEF